MDTSSEQPKVTNHLKDQKENIMRKLKSSCARAALAAPFVLLPAHAMSAEYWVNMKEDSAGHTRARGWVEYRTSENPRYGEMVELKIVTENKTTGTLKTGQAVTSFIIYDKNGNVWKDFKVTQHASTNASGKRVKKGEDEVIQFRANEFDAHYGYHQMVVSAEPGINVPTTPKEIEIWAKKELGPAFDKARLNAMGEGASWIIGKKMR